ncbi:phage holin, LLH family [Lactiplantibacillus daowaiensis]|uniref:Phage holin, LLH family n=1 Tax=Lactiplantibacillus daowaiensis TaxID=2559918 RepID=A0ABW1RXW9_9LACO|nr:phage holin, LLH family [Lactiplantibacillus daowaiensis]
MKTTTDIINWITGGGLTLVAFVVASMLIKAWPVIKSILDAKEAASKDAKTKSRYEQLEKWAQNAVAALSVYQDVTGADKKKEAIRIINKQLADHKIDIDIENVGNAVEAAYQAFKTTQPTTDTVATAPTTEDTDTTTQE